MALGQPEPAENRRLAAVGRQLPDKEVRIFNDVDEELPIGSTGEIVLRGGFMKAYWNRPDKTEETLRGGWLHTGDVGFMDEDGFVFFRGRLSERLLVDGEYWYPRDLEEALLGHPEVKEAALVGAPDANLGMRPVAFVMTTDGLGFGLLVRRLSSRSCPRRCELSLGPAGGVDAVHPDRQGELRRAPQID